MVYKKVSKSSNPVTVGEEDILILSDGALKLYMYFLRLNYSINPTMENTISYLCWSDKKYKKYKRELEDKKYLVTQKNSIKGGGSSYNYYVGKRAVAERLEYINGN